MVGIRVTLGNYAAPRFDPKPVHTFKEWYALVNSGCYGTLNLCAETMMIHILSLTDVL